jgi:hypothetical protein
MRTEDRHSSIKRREFLFTVARAAGHREAAPVVSAAVVCRKVKYE